MRIEPLFSDSSGRTGGEARPTLHVRLAAPRGFCAGVRRAIAAVEEAIARYGAPVYVRRPIVHNLTVVRTLEAKGAIFVQELDEVPEGGVVLMSAHGISKEVAQEAEERALTWFDAVCPLVAKVHREVVRHHADGRHVILIGHEGHPEIEGTLGQLPAGAASLVRTAAEVQSLDLSETLPVAYAVQTTYSVEEASEVVAAVVDRFSDVAGPASSDICYATTNRQAVLRLLAGEADAVIVAGEPFSSNACRLVEVARAAGCRHVQLVAEPDQLDLAALSEARTITISAAASAPEETVQGIVARLQTRFEVALEEAVHLEENAVFKPLRFV